MPDPFGGDGSNLAGNAREFPDNGAIERAQFTPRDQLAPKYRGACLSLGPHRRRQWETLASGHSCFKQSPGAVADDPDRQPRSDEVTHKGDHETVAGKLLG